MDIPEHLISERFLSLDDFFQSHIDIQELILDRCLTIFNQENLGLAVALPNLMVDESHESRIIGYLPS